MKRSLGHYRRIGSRPIGWAPFPPDSPRGSTTPTGMQPRPAGPTLRPSPSPERAGRLETLNRAFSGGCEYPSRNAPQRAEGGGGRPGQGSPAFPASAPKQVMRRTNPGRSDPSCRIPSVLPILFSPLPIGNDGEREEPVPPFSRPLAVAASLDRPPRGTASSVPRRDKEGGSPTPQGPWVSRLPRESSVRPHHYPPPTDVCC